MAVKKYLFPFTYICAVVSFSILFACNKNTSTDPVGPDNTIPAEQRVTASLQGRVLDEQGQPVAGAVVVSGTVSTTTDVNGVFSFSNISMSSRFGFVKVNKSGYFTGSRSVITNGGASNFVSIQLIPRTSKGQFAASTGGLVPVSAGDSVLFPAAGFVNATTGAAYTGNVNVFAAYLDPTAKDLYKYMPGDLRGIGKNGKETALQSFGMLAVEMEGDAGEKLQLASGKKAVLTMAIPASLQATASATIPLWYFNDSSGRWIEEGAATRVGNSYVGQVAHFSYWNCDAPTGAVGFKVRLKDQFGNPLAYTYIQFVAGVYGTRGGYTDSTGFAQGLIPNGVSMMMQVVTTCGNMLAGINVGPALSDQDLGTITVTTNADAKFTGKVVDCSGNPVDSGYVTIQIDGLNYAAFVKKGVFTLPVSRCYSAVAPAKVTAFDLITLQKGSTTTVSAGNGDVDAGVLTACGVDVNQFINVTFEGSSYNFSNPLDSVLYSLNGYLTFTGYRTSLNGGSILISVSNVTGPATYPASLSFSDRSVNNGATKYGNGTCTITAYGPVGSFVTGTFTGNVSDSLGPQYPISGQLRVKRVD